jgi:hypothetical protein
MGVAGLPVKLPMPRQDVIGGRRVESDTSWPQPAAVFAQGLAMSTTAANRPKKLEKKRPARSAGRQAGKSRGAMVYCL